MLKVTMSMGFYSRITTFLICFLFCTVPFLSLSQFDICGRVTVGNQPAANCLVRLIGIKDSSYTNKYGEFCFSSLAEGNYGIRAISEEHISSIENVSITNKNQFVVIQMKPHQLSGVTINGQRISHAEQQKASSIKTEIIDVGKKKHTSVSVQQMMNRTAGINIRNSGGVGAKSDIIVSGFNGKSVKLLINGIPMDYLGSSMNISRLQSGSIQYIEIYKGVLPPEIGIDALGGAINIITNSSGKTHHSMSYEIGSFNTHKANVQLFFSPKNKKGIKKIAWGVNLLGTYAKNNFQVENSPIVDAKTGRTNYIEAQLFHNGYKQISGAAFLNLLNLKWADFLQFKINSYGLKKEMQNDFSSRSRAFGQAFRKEYAYLIPSVHYKKRFFNHKFLVDQFVVFSKIQYALVDTARNLAYDWLGVPHFTSSPSEMGLGFSEGEDPIIETTLDNLTYRGLFSYQLNHNHKLVLNMVDNLYTRNTDASDGSNTRMRYRYNRTIVGAGYQYKLFEKHLVGLSQVKFLGAQAFDLTAFTAPIINNGWSFAQSLKYESHTGWIIRASIENTYRLPEQTELFGNNTLILPNLSLTPERSLNVNFGVRFYRPKVGFEVNSYWRSIKDMIRLKEISQFQAQFLNLNFVNGYGIEIKGRYRPIKQLELSGNLTYNEFRYQGAIEKNAEYKNFVNARVSNMPFYFGNAHISYDFKNWMNGKTGLKLYWTYTYIHQYYLDFIEKQFEPDGFLGLFGESQVYTDRVIPFQQIHSCGFIYNFELKEQQKIYLSAEWSNIFDKDVYSNYRMQGAGSRFSTKITFEF